MEVRYSKVLTQHDRADLTNPDSTAKNTYSKYMDRILSAVGFKCAATSTDGKENTSIIQNLLAIAAENVSAGRLLHTQKAAATSLSQQPSSKLPVSAFFVGLLTFALPEVSIPFITSSLGLLPLPDARTLDPSVDANHAAGASSHPITLWMIGMPWVEDEKAAPAEGESAENEEQEETQREMRIRVEREMRAENDAKQSELRKCRDGETLRKMRMRVKREMHDENDAKQSELRECQAIVEQQEEGKHINFKERHDSWRYDRRYQWHWVCSCCDPTAAEKEQEMRWGYVSSVEEGLCDLPAASVEGVRSHLSSNRHQRSKHKTQSMV